MFGVPNGTERCTKRHHRAIKVITRAPNEAREPTKNGPRRTLLKVSIIGPFVGTTRAQKVAKWHQYATKLHRKSHGRARVHKKDPGLHCVRMRWLIPVEPAKDDRINPQPPPTRADAPNLRKQNS